MRLLHTTALRIGLWSLSLLIIPFTANFYLADFNWSLGDFLVFALLLFSLGYGIGLSLKFDTKKRLRLIGSFIIAFLLIWAELAVGVFSNSLLSY